MNKSGQIDFINKFGNDLQSVGRCIKLVAAGGIPSVVIKETTFWYFSHLLDMCYQIEASPSNDIPYYILELEKSLNGLKFYPLNIPDDTSFISLLHNLLLEYSNKKLFNEEKEKFKRKFNKVLPIKYKKKGDLKAKAKFNNILSELNLDFVITSSQANDTNHRKETYWIVMPKN